MNINKNLLNENGFILPLALVWLLTASILAGSIGYMARSSSLQETSWKNNDICFAIAHAIVGEMRSDMLSDFDTYFKLNQSRPTAMREWYENVLKVETELTNRKLVKTNLNISTENKNNEKYPTNWNDATITTRVADYRISPDGSYIDIMLQGFAKLGTGRKGIEEHMRISLDTGVFNYAYFMNNKGWMYGSSIYLNGDVRANGNFEFQYNPTVNGSIWAAWNYENNSSGSISTGYISQNASSYKSDWLTGRKSGTSNARPRSLLDVNNSDTLGGYDPSLLSSNKMPAHSNQDPLAMPYLGDLDSYKTLAANEASKGWSMIQYKDENGVTRTAKGVLSNPAGPDGKVGTADDNTIIINGDFKIMGPLVVEGDLIIKGNYKGFDKDPTGQTVTEEDIELYTTEDERAKQPAKKIETLVASRKFTAINGKGGFFVGRNVHVIGNIAADVVKSGSNNAALTEDDPFLSIAAKGCVIAGAPQDLSAKYAQSIDTYGSYGFTRPFSTMDVDFQNTTVAYKDVYGNTYSVPGFDGNYTHTDRDLTEKPGVSLGTVYQVVSSSGITNPSNNQIFVTSNPAYIPGLNLAYNTSSIKINGIVYEVSFISSKSNVYVNENGKSVLKNGYTVTIKGKHSGLNANPNNNSAEYAPRYYQPTIDYDLMTKLGGNSSGSRPSIVDAVLYTNHLTGGTWASNAAINGSLIGRDEAYSYSGKLTMNWDQRLAQAGANSTTGVGQILSYLVPRTFDPTYDPDRPVLLYWRVIPYTTLVN
ncbi:MAG: hypothetical protein ACRC37_05745 [Lentisphaeria bacterium]